MPTIFSRPTARKVLGELAQHPTRSITVILSIAVGIVAIGAIATAIAFLPADMAASYAASNPASIELSTDSFDQGFVDAIERLDGIAEAEGQRYVTVRVQTPTGAWSSLRLTAVDEPGQQRINQPILLAGAAQPESHQLLLTSTAAERLGAQEGQTMIIELADGTAREMTVAGVVMDLGGGYEALTGTNIAYVAESDLEWLHAALGYDRLVLTLSASVDDSAHIHDVAETVIDRLEDSGRGVYGRIERGRSRHPLQNIINALLGVLSLLGALVLFLSGSLITNTLSSMLTQQVHQVGIMKLVGGSRQQIASIYLWLVSIYALLALGLAIPLGALAGNAMTHLAGSIINIPLANNSLLRTSLLAVAIQVVVGLGVPLVAALLPIQRGTGISVRSALRETNAGDSANSQGLLTRVLARLTWLPRLLLISLRNTFRNKQRLWLTLGTLMLGGAIFVGVLNAQVALNHKVSDVSRYFDADVNLDMAALYHPQRVAEVALGVPGVTAIEAWGSTTANLLDEYDDALDDVTLLGPPAETELVQPTMLSGRWIAAGDEAELVVSEAFAQAVPGLKVGSTLRLEIGDDEQDWTVVGIFQFTGTDELVAYCDWSYLSRVLGQHNRSAMYRVVTDEHTLAYQQQVAHELDDRLTAAGLHVANAEAGLAFTQSMTGYLGVLTGVLLIMAGLTAAVGSIGLAGTLSLNVLERSREIGILRAIGAHDGIIVQMVLVEGLLIGLLSYIGGAVLAIPISFGLTEIISQAIFGSAASVTLAAHSFGIWFGLVLVLATLSSLLPAKRATHLTVRQVLAYE